MKAITLSDARNLYAIGRLQMRVNKHGRIECLVGSQLVRVTRSSVDRQQYRAHELQIKGRVK